MAEGGGGETALDVAIFHRHPILAHALPGGPGRVAEVGAAERKEFEDAVRVITLSLRYETPPGLASGPFLNNPRRHGDYAKRMIEGKECPLACVKAFNPNSEGNSLVRCPVAGAKAFNPNSDNAFLMLGVAEQANAIWLKNWRWALGLSWRTGGRVLQIVVGGLSFMQQAEAEMAADKGVPVFRVDMTGKDEEVLDDEQLAELVEKVERASDAVAEGQQAVSARGEVQ